MSSPYFAVLGASKDQSKVGTKVGFVVSNVDCMHFLNVISRQILKWYQVRDKDVVPVHPVCSDQLSQLIMLSS